MSPAPRCYPGDRMARARCRSISGEMHSGFSALRSSLPMNLRLHRPGFTLWSAARADIDRITRNLARMPARPGAAPGCSAATPASADAMYAPVVTRFRSYDVALDAACDAYCDQIMAWPAMQEWIAAALHEPEQIEELDVEF